MERVIKLSQIIDNLGQIKGEKSLQKIVYLIQSFSEPLGYNFTLNSFGPISFDIEKDIKEAEALGFTRIDWENNIPIYKTNKKKDQITTYWRNKFEQIELSQKIQNSISTFSKLLHEYYSDPFKLELIATYDYLQKQGYDETQTINVIKQKYSEKIKNSDISQVKNLLTRINTQID